MWVAAWSRCPNSSAPHWVNDSNGRGACTYAFAKLCYWWRRGHVHSCDARLFHLYSEIWSTKSFAEGFPLLPYLSHASNVCVINACMSPVDSNCPPNWDSIWVCDLYIKTMKSILDTCRELIKSQLFLRQSLWSLRWHDIPQSAVIHEKLLVRCLRGVFRDWRDRSFDCRLPPTRGFCIHFHQCRDHFFCIQIVLLIKHGELACTEFQEVHYL